MDERPRYMISVAAEIVGMHPQTLRIYEQKGLVRPKRTPGNTRLYSERDLERLRLIQGLTTEFGLNLAGVEAVLRLRDEVERLQGRIARLERQLQEEIQKVHTEIGTRYGERLALEMGIDPALATVFDAASVKAAMGLPADVEKLTYRDVQERWELIRSRLEARRKNQRSREDR